MAIASSTFGRVTLTGDDARKFKRQVTFGRPKAVAKANVEQGVKLARDFRANGRRLVLTVPSGKS